MTLAIGKVYLTKRGRNLIAKGVAGEQIVFTRFAIGDGELTGQAIEDLNGLLNYKQTVPIGRKQVKDIGILKLSGNLSNTENGGFYYRELGLFATDPDLGEILYAYGNAGDMAEYIPLFQEEIYEKTILLNAYHGSAENVTAVMDESLIFATKEEVEEIYTSLENKADKNLGNVPAEDFRTAFFKSGLGTEVADKPTLDVVATDVSDVKDKIGETGDTVGTTSTGSVFGKLNAIRQQFVSYWTPTRAGKLDNLDTTVSSRASQNSIDGIGNKIGDPNDPQSGSVTTGSIFGKFNYITPRIGSIYSLVNALIERLTAKRAENLDHIGSVVSTEGDRYRAIMEKIKKETPVLPDYSRTIQVKGKKLYTIGSKQVRVFDTETFEQIAISPEQEGGCNVFFVDNNYLYYLDTIGDKVVKLNATTLTKVKESAKQSDAAWYACMADNKIYYCPHAYHYIVALDANTLEEISRSSSYIDTINRLYAYNNIVYFQDDYPSNKLIAVDGTTLAKKKEKTYSFGTATSHICPICVYNSLLYCIISYSKSDGKKYCKVITLNPNTLELNQKESAEFESVVHDGRYTFKDNLMYFFADGTSRIFILNMDNMALVSAIETTNETIISICVDDYNNAYWSGVSTKKVYSTSEGVYKIKGYEKEE